VRLATLAPAKVNLVLRVGPRREDGYHDLVSLMAPLDLADEVDVRVSARPGPPSCSARASGSAAPSRSGS
jgi:4-diphosphocytidyl-2-C-methyl-D-erythritol kinase